MKPYSELTRRGKLKRLRQLTLTALKEYNLQLKWVKFLTIETNTMFQLQTQNGDKYVLRIYCEEDTTLSENLAEIFWLHRLKQDTSLKITEPIPRQDGEYITIASLPGVPGERRCVLFKWIPGRTLESNLSAENYFKLGRILAKLHDHAETLNPLPPTVQLKEWNQVFYYPSEPSVLGATEYRHLFPPERVELLNQVINRANQVFKQLYAAPEKKILIHGDLHYWNVHFHRGELYVLDFGDIMLGYPVQDIAIALSYGREREGYNEWREAFREGYSGLRRWPAESEWEIETLMAARKVMCINCVAQTDPTPQKYIADACKQLKHFLEVHG